MAFLPESPLRIVLGIPFVLFFPGYALITALAPRKTAMSAIERVALSFGLSIALVVLVGLALNYTPFGIRLYPIAFSLAGLLLVLSGIAWFRERRLPADERVSISLHLSPGTVWKGAPLDRVLTVLLVVAIVGSVGAIVYTIAKPKAGEQFSEFYILGPNGKAADYPSQVTVGARSSVTGGIVNHFRTAVTYRIAVSVDGTAGPVVGPMTLQPGETWEGKVSFQPAKTGPDQKVEFTLQEDPMMDASPLSLHLWVDVTE